MAKRMVSATLVVALVLLMTAPAAMAQKPEPPEGWFAFGVQNTRNTVTSIFAQHDATMCQNSIIYNPGRYSESCERWNRRVWTGQIDGLWRQKMRHDFYTNGYGTGWGYYGGDYGYMGYGPGGYWFQRQDTATKIMLGAVIGLTAWKLIADHRRGNEQKKTVKENTEAVNRQASVETELLEELRRQRQSGTTAQSPGGSAVNATGCDIIVRERSGRQVEVPNGKSRQVTDVEGFTVKTMPGYCPNGVVVEYTKDREVGVISCDN